MWYAGIDWAAQHHDAVVRDEAGQRVATRRGAHTAEGLAELTTFLRGIGDVAEHPEHLACLVETSHGLLISALLEAGLPVYPVNPKTETMGGELIDTGYHPSYMLLYLATGEPVEVTAMLSRFAIASIEGEDSAQVLVRFADGSVGNIVTSWAYELPVGAWQFQVIGERGQIYGIDNRLYYKPHQFEPAALTLPEVNNVDAEIAHFVACVRDGRTPVQTHVHGINVLKLILAAYRSEAEKRTMALTRDA